MLGGLERILKKRLHNAISYGVLAASLAITDYKMHSIFCNTLYCSARSVVCQDAERRVRVCMGYAGLDKKSRESVRNAFGKASDDFAKRFGIRLDIADEVEAAPIGGLRKASSIRDEIRLASRAQYDFAMYFTCEDIIEQDSDGRIIDILAICDRAHRMISFDKADRFSSHNLTKIILHETAHMFFANHSDNPESIMYPYMCDDQDHYGRSHPEEAYGRYDEDTMNAVKRYKWRFW